MLPSETRHLPLLTFALNIFFLGNANSLPIPPTLRCYLSHSSSCLYTPMAAGETNGDGDLFKSLELQLEALQVELTTVRNERSKQRQQLEQLQQEQTNLVLQKEQRDKRNQLSEQMFDLEISVGKKEQAKQKALEDLEQAKSRYRQLKRTFGLLKEGVSDIIEKSTQDFDTSIEGTRKAAARQQILDDLLKQDWLKSAPFAAFEDDASEADEIEDDSDHYIIGLFSRKSAAASKMVSSSTRSDRTSRSEPTRSERSGRSKTRADSSKPRTDRSRSASSRKGRARRRSKKQDEDNQSKPLQPVAPIKQSALAAMLEAGKDDSSGSEDTPKTANTRDSQK